ncbi:MAG: DUF2163 domain-containing protein [Novosphingobium sp.]
MTPGEGSTRVWFSGALETVATYWRVARRDGVTIGFTTHDNDLWFDGLLHRTAPGMLPSAIRRSADFEPDSAEVEGALSHESISAADLAAGRFDGARVAIGLVDWTTLERHVLYRGGIGSVLEEAGKFTAQLASRKAELQRDPVPRTSPTCRAVFCGPGCTLSPARFTHEGVLVSADTSANTVTVTAPVTLANFTGGLLRWIDGPLSGVSAEVIGIVGNALVLGSPLDQALTAGLRVTLREGCDRTLDTCATRFANAINFQGEPYLPGNDLIARYPSSSA